MASLTVTPTTPLPGQLIGVLSDGLQVTSNYSLRWDGSSAGMPSARSTSVGTLATSVYAPQPVGPHVLTLMRLGVVTAQVTVNVTNTPVVVPPTPTPIPPTPVPGGLLSWPRTDRCTELPPWDRAQCDAITSPAIYAAIKTVLRPKIVRILPWWNGTLFTAAEIATVCGAIRDWGAVPMVKGPCWDMYPSATVADYMQVGDEFIKAFPSGFFWESTNELDMLGSQGQGGVLTGRQWCDVFVPFRKQFTAKYPAASMVWLGPGMTNFGNVTDPAPYSDPTQLFFDTIKAGYNAAPAADKQLFVPHAYSIHTYPDVPLNQITNAVAFYRRVSVMIRNIMSATFPGETIRLTVTEWNLAQNGMYRADWDTALLRTGYQQMHDWFVADNIWLAVQFMAHGDEGSGADGTPDLLRDDGSLYQGGQVFRDVFV